MKKALIVRGGWEGHWPKENTNTFIPFLQEHSYEVRVEESTAVYADSIYMQTVDLILQCISMGTIKENEFAGLEDAVIRGAGFAGWHGGVVCAFPNTPRYMQMTGGVFVGHPGKSSEECVGNETDYFVPHSYVITDAGKVHEITRDIEDFDLVTEQYWVLQDTYNQVLATTTQKVRLGDPWHEEVTSPAIWTRRWGAGKIFIITCGHNLDVVMERNVHLIIERGLLWASK